ncbi:hypothetical protein MYX82_08570 [Acidobacteria bacterium AH-259-D05]|nr:hypothetical protein [Acidobacteria bacterium AH-259-D05]
MWGYQEFLEAIMDPNHEEHERMLEWVRGSFDSEQFDPTQVRFDDPEKALGDSSSAFGPVSDVRFNATRAVNSFTISVKITALKALMITVGIGTLLVRWGVRIMRAKYIVSSLETVHQAVKMVGGQMTTEVSGGVTPETAAELAATGVDLLSIGWLRHSAPALDMALDLESL